MNVIFSPSFNLKTGSKHFSINCRPSLPKACFLSNKVNLISPDRKVKFKCFTPLLNTLCEYLHIKQFLMTSLLRKFAALFPSFQISHHIVVFYFWTKILFGKSHVSDFSCTSRDLHVKIFPQ